MSCIRFSTPAQIAQYAAHAPLMGTSYPVTVHPAPEFTHTKRARLRRLAADPSPKIREAAASSPHLPLELQIKLAADVDAGVRGAIARNFATEPVVVRYLRDDESATVRGHVAINVNGAPDLLRFLANDRDPTVRALVAWRFANA